jgi:protein disulfide-isomerase A1
MRFIFLPLFLLSPVFGGMLESLLMELMATSGGDAVAEGKDENVKALDSTEAFNSFVGSKDTVSAIFFTAPWCIPCRPLLEIWAQSAAMIKNQTQELPIQFGVIEISKFPEVAESNHIFQLPTLKLYVDGEIFSYSPERVQQPFSAGAVTSWVNKHTNRKNLVDTKELLEAFLKANPVTVVSILDSSDKSAIFREAIMHSSHHFEDVQFLEIPDSLAAGLAGICNRAVIENFPAIVMVYDHDDKYAVFDAKSSDLIPAIDRFVRGRRLNTVNAFVPPQIDRIMDSGLPLLILVSPSRVVDEESKVILTRVAQRYLGQLVAVTVGGSSMPWDEKMTEILDAKSLDFPDVRILELPDENTHDHDSQSQGRAAIKKGRKYKRINPDRPFTEPDLVVFIEAYLRKELKPHIKSEPLPEDPNDSYTPGSVLINAVGLNFEKFVTQDINRDILVVYHADFCGHCRRLSPTIRELGVKLAGNSKVFKIVRIEATKNDIPDVEVAGYPLILLYKNTDKVTPLNLRPHVEYQGDRSIESLVQFIKQSAVNKINENAVITPNAGKVVSDSMFFEEL